MAALWWVLTGAMSLSALLWLGLVLALVQSARDRRFVLDPKDEQPALPNGPVMVSIVIPARNEEGRIGKAVRSALDQDYRALEVVVVDDDSSDETAAEARAAADGDKRFKLISGRMLPQGWLGKPSACWYGKQKTRGEILLFVDADVKLAPEGVGCAVRALEDRGLDLLSVWGTWQVESFWEKVCQPVVGGFVRGAHPLDQVNDPQGEVAFANGQFIMIRKAAYEKFGGHEAVKGEVLEDVRFAQAAKAAGLACGMFLGPGIFSVRLYTSLSEIWQGMIKNFYHGMDRQPGLALAAAGFVGTMTLLPFVILGLGLALGHWPMVAAAGLNVAFLYAFRWIQDGVVGLSRWYGITHPLGTLVLLGIILVSMWRGLRGAPTAWKGRAVQG